MAVAAFNPAWQKLGNAKSQSYTVIDADIIYDGTAVTVLGSTGEAQPAADAADMTFVGIAKSKVDNTDDGETVEVDGSNDTTFWMIAGTNLTPAATDIGGLAFVEDDQTATDQAGATHNVLLGQIVDVDVANARVLIKSMASTPAAKAATTNLWTVTNRTADYDIDCDATVDVIGDGLGSLIEELISLGILRCTVA